MNDDLKWLAENVHGWKDGAIAVRRNGCGLPEWFFESEKPYHSSATRTQWQDARDELSGKPGWELAPEGHDWLAQDGDGQWYFYNYIPVLIGCSFSAPDNVAANGSYRTSSAGRVLGDWRNTLERRPEAVEETVEEEVEEYGPFALYDAVAQYRNDHPEPTINPLRAFALSQIRAAADICITDDDVREVFINLITELDDEALAGVAGRVVK